MRWPWRSRSYRLTSITYLLKQSPYTPPKGCRALMVKPGNPPKPNPPLPQTALGFGWGGMAAFGFGSRPPHSLYRAEGIHDPEVLAMIDDITVIWEFQ